MGLGGCGIGYHRYLANKVVHEEVIVKNRGICNRDTNIKICTGAEFMEDSSRFLRQWNQYHGPNQKQRKVD